MNKENIEKLVGQLLLEIGEDGSREGLIDTPKRVAKMYEEVFRGYIEEPPVITTFENGHDGINYDEMITDEGTFASYCEHHMVRFYGRYYFAYIPDKKILGISKVARTVDHFSSKLQIQERLTQEIANHIYNTVMPKGLALVMKGRHLCKEMRGAKKINAPMTSTVLLGDFKNKEVKDEFFQTINLNAAL